MLFEPLTPAVRDMIINDVKTIIDYDPRIMADEVKITQYDSGLQISCSLTYLPYYITEQLQMKFDETNGLMVR